MGNAKRTTKQSPSSQDLVLGVPDASRTLNLSKARVKQLASAGRIGRKVAGRYLFSAAELADFMRTPRLPGNPNLRRRKDL